MKKVSLVIVALTLIRCSATHNIAKKSKTQKYLVDMETGVTEEWDGDKDEERRLRSELKEEKILEYYIRSEALVKHAKYAFDQSFWALNYQRFVAEIVRSLKADDKTSAISNIFKMLEILEQEFQL